MPIYTVTCRGDIGRGVITQLSERGISLWDEPELGFEGDGMKRHFLRIEASSPEDAILVTKGAMAVTGGGGRAGAAAERGRGGGARLRGDRGRAGVARPVARRGRRTECGRFPTRTRAPRRSSSP